MRIKDITIVAKQHEFFKNFRTMEYKFIGDSVNLLRGVEDFDERAFSGCSEAQIEALEKLLPEYFYLPESYYEFLKFGGNGIFTMLTSTNFYF